MRNISKKKTTKAKSKPRVKTVPMPTTVKDMLNLIDRFMVESRTTVGEGLWNVMTALRGPDNAGFTIKAATTAVIRHAAFPLSAKHPYRNMGSTGPDGPGLAAIRQGLIVNSDHFLIHAHDAFRTLGLPWHPVVASTEVKP